MKICFYHSTTPEDIYWTPNCIILKSANPKYLKLAEDFLKVCGI